MNAGIRVFVRRSLSGDQLIPGTISPLPTGDTSASLRALTEVPKTPPPDWNGGNWSNLDEVPARLDLSEDQVKRILLLLRNASKATDALRVAVLGLRDEKLPPDVLRKLMLRFAAFLGGGVLR